MAVPFKDKVYVILQFIFFAAYILEWAAMKFLLSNNLKWIGFFVALAGLLLIFLALFQLRKNLTAFPSPRSTSQLKTNGAFAFARHPIYAGIIFMSFGIAIWLGSGYKFLISIFLFILFYTKSNYEEKRLIEMFPEYAAYRKTTGRFFPKFRGRI